MNLSLERLLIDYTEQSITSHQGGAWEVSLAAGSTVAATQSGTWDIGTVGTITNVVKVSDNDGSLTVDGTVAATQSGAWEVSFAAGATVAATQSGTWNVNISDNAGSITVDAVALDIRALAYASDSVTAHQGGTWDIGTVGTITNEVKVFEVPNIAVTSVNLSVVDTATAITSLANRRRIQVQNKGSDPVYIGGSGVAFGTGIEINKGATWSADAGAVVEFYLIADTGKTVNCGIMQLS